MRQIINGFLASGLLMAAQATAAPADDIKQFLEQNKPAEAYQAGKSQPDQYGDPAFDFFFGIAAIDAGHPGEGVLALERYLLNYPDNRSARFQLARGYFVLGEDLRARDEFETLRSQAEGGELQAAERFLDAIRSRESRYNPTANAYLEAGIGFDSNINAGLNSGASPNVPGYGNLPIQTGNSISSKESDSFTSVTGGVQGVYPVSPGVALIGSVGFEMRSHHESRNDVFDQLNIGATAGASFLKDNNIYKLGLGLGQLWLDNQRYVLTPNIFAEWSHQYDQYNRFEVSGQWAYLSYDKMSIYPLKDKSAVMVTSDNTIRNADFYGITGGWTRVFEGEYRPVLKVTANYGEEHNRHDRPDLSRNILGVRGNLNFAPAPRWSGLVGVGYQESRYRDTFDFPGATSNRRDKVWSLDAGVAYQYDRNISFRADYTHTDQGSNIGLYEYNRDLVMLKVRYDLK